MSRFLGKFCLLSEGGGMPQNLPPLFSGPYQLRVSNPAGLATPLLQGLVDCWRHSYERMAIRFNPQAPRRVNLQAVDKLGHPGVTLGADIRIDAGWIRDNPGDVDVMTHEQFHVIQNYGPGAEPGWAVEGLADYARWKYGFSNQQWSLPARRPEHRWTDSYRVTAAFFRWLEAHRHASFPEELNQALRARTYGDSFWHLHFGKPIAQLWTDYTNS